MVVTHLEARAEIRNHPLQQCAPVRRRLAQAVAQAAVLLLGALLVRQALPLGLCARISRMPPSLLREAPQHMQPLAALPATEQKPRSQIHRQAAALAEQEEAPPCPLPTANQTMEGTQATQVGKLPYRPQGQIVSHPSWAKLPGLEARLAYAALKNSLPNLGQSCPILFPACRRIPQRRLGQRQEAPAQLHRAGTARKLRILCHTL